MIDIARNAIVIKNVVVVIHEIISRNKATIAVKKPDANATAFVSYCLNIMFMIRKNEYSINIANQP